MQVAPRRDPECQATIILRRQRQLESPMTKGVFLPRVLLLLSVAKQQQHTRAGRNVRPLVDLYFCVGGGTSGDSAALDFFACSTR